ncbi:LOW QUALITY PROTEIN: adhesion G-protein coupled receptor V1 [Bombina bombina]|uniref:LOW QUALITY PROTEIN: adhesion G-protein coupled receptor V1 n=1 Tax=Bombina bombina TaxID=8345 RepID=UPI00235B3003|nr:LOW QUALITY PROTEIN: adhesion G-protein coupled receptor V1 [Bombina bombina]
MKKMSRDVQPVFLVGAGMPSVSFITVFLLGLFITLIAGETQVQFAGQTDFFVNETSTTVIRLIIERTGVPVNVTAIVQLQGENTGDFVETVTAAFIPDRETNRTVYISVCDDDLPEADETFHFRLTLQNPPLNTKLGSPNVATVTILSNDNAFGIISLNMPAFITVIEPQGRNQSLPLVLIREKGTYGTVTVTFEVEGGPNPADEDLTPTTGNITFSTGRSVLIYNLTILDDQVPENDEHFTLKLTNVFGGAEINTTRSAIQINIEKNDSPVRFRQSSFMVPEEADVITVPVIRGKNLYDIAVGSDGSEVSVKYKIVTGNLSGSAQLNIDFLDLQPNNSIVFPPKIYEVGLKFQIIDDTIPEIAESFMLILVEETLQGDAVLQTPNVVHITIEPNDKPYGVLSINSTLFEKTVIIDEDQMSKFEGITIVRNGGTHSNVSVQWNIKRNNTDPSPVTADIVPDSGVLQFAEGQMSARIPLQIISDDIPEEAEMYRIQILANTVKGGAEVGLPTELVFYIQDSDDVYGLFQLHDIKDQKIESSPEGRFLTLRFERRRGTKGVVKLFYSALYIPAGPIDPVRAKEGVLNVSSRNNIAFPEGESLIIEKLPIRNDAFLQNGANFLVQLEFAELLSPTPLVPPISPRLGSIQNISLSVTPDIANGEIGFTSNMPIIVSEPENVPSDMVSIALHRDGTGGEAVVFWSLQPIGLNAKSITLSDLSPFNGSVTFLPGQSDTAINITIKADDIPEVNETVIISLDRVETERFVVYFRVNVENQILKSGFTSCELTILENDDPGGVFEFTPSSRGPYRVKEGDSVELRIVRSKGLLVKQFLRYIVEPKDSNEFYGNTGILEFKTGEKEIVITLLTRMDEIPELDEMYSVVLSSHGEYPSTLGEASRVNITIEKNDDPHGVLEFINDRMVISINESKGNEIYTAEFEVIRNQGMFGNISVTWIINPDSTGDVYPTHGVLHFEDKEFSKNITVSSLSDEVPEEKETFILRLLNANGEARIGSVSTAMLEINKNDDAVFFAEPILVWVEEGQDANFTIVRNGSADYLSSVMYSLVNGVAITEEGDFNDISQGNMLVFDIGQTLQNITIYTIDDDIPETDEPFYIILLNTTGDTVVSGNGKATVIIRANDDPNGIFFLEPVDKMVEEGKTNNFKIVRSRGHFGNVLLHWQLLENDYTVLVPGQEFYETSGTVWFGDKEEFQYITLHAVPDNIPEFNEFYILQLVNISGGTPGPGGKMAEKNINVTVMIPFNDDPFGVFVISHESQDREVAEDVLSEDDMRYITNFSIWRHQGTYGNVRVGWEIYSSFFKHGLPPMEDILLLASFSSSVELQPHMRRHHSGTDALYFSGAEDAFGIIEGQQYYNILNNSLANFTFSAWIIPNVNTNGFIISKDNDNGTIYFGVKVETNDSYIVLMLFYMTVGSNSTYSATAGVPKFIAQNSWIHILITLDDGILEFYIDENLVPGGVKSLKGEAIANGAGTFRVGAGIKGENRYTGLMQDVRIYQQKLSQAEMTELHGTPAKNDLHPISGYLEYRQGETHKSFIVSTRDDSEEEGEENFILKLVSVHGGARIPEENTTALIQIQKSDNANGLFGFTGPCIPESAEEGTTISCVIERRRGALDTVHLFYTITQMDAVSGNDSAADFTSISGNSTFLPFQRSKVLNLNVVDDEIPELAEHFRVTLVSVVSEDGKIGSTPTSGASIDPEKKDEVITINASDHPYGLLQFSVTPPKPGDKIVPAESIPTITVKEEIGSVKLIVVRAQGLLGHVAVEYRTEGITAFSPQDYEESSGVLEFSPGERHKYISVNITDNSLPELAKSFKVELLNSNAGASLGTASHIIVIIEDSDDAHGMFEFRHESLSMNATEPEYGYTSVNFQVFRGHGTLSKVILFWTIELASSDDLAFSSGNVTFEIGQRIANLTVQVSPDDVPELDEMFRVLITNVSSGRLGIYTEANLTIFANDDPYGLFIFSEKNRPIKVEEKNINITLTIKRLKGLMGNVIVAYKTLADSDKLFLPPSNIARATEGKDYLSVSGNVHFKANMSEVNIFLPILDDDDPERAESLFVALTNVTLEDKEQHQLVLDSPQLGSKIETVAHVIINASDDAFGVLQLSTTVVRVAENYVGPIINVTRTGGMFADVSVKFKAVPITATAGEDYSIASSDVVLLEGETSKAVPIYIINDINPEVEESFHVLLINYTTGGAQIGEITEAIIIIEASDDPYGLFVFQVTSLTVDEPDFNSVKINLPIIRNSGTLGKVVVQWVATVNGQLAIHDLKSHLGNVTFTPGETSHTLLIEILADDIPEIDEVIEVRLTEASNGGTIGFDGVAKILIPANDNPYGTISFHLSLYRVQEPLEARSYANITIRRSAGRFGYLQILYSTTEIDVVGLAIEQGHDILSYYEIPLPGISMESANTRVNVSQSGNPLHSCAITCLKNQVCTAFSFNGASDIPQCFWFTKLSNQLHNYTGFWTYRKNSTGVSALFSTQATAGSDYETVTGKWITMMEEEEFANLSVSILTDTFPELDEEFIVSLLEVKLLNISTSIKNQPTIGHPNTSVVAIMMNGDAFGVFVIYNLNPNTTEEGHHVEVEEQHQTTVQLVIERREGSLGQVTVEWGVIGGTAVKNMDFITTDEVLIFAEGETRKLVTITILDDSEPEDQETIIIQLIQTDGGSRILPSFNTVNIVILANDNVAGVISFQTSSRSVIGREGEKLKFDVLRTPPGRGNVTVFWKVIGYHLELNFENSTGILFFPEELLNTSFIVHLLDDHIPEEKEEYRLVLYNLSTQGVSGAGAAVLDKQGYEAVLTVEASDEPHGVINFAPSSRIVVTQEANKTIHLYVNREYGSLGNINITYETTPGFMPNLNQSGPRNIAQPGLDYIAAFGSLILQDGETTATINITILEDEIPELQEYFTVTLISVELIVKLVTSSPPKLDIEGLSAQIIIDTNDGVQGIIEWQSTSYEINETQGVLTLVVFRNVGTHGNVSVFFYAQNLGAVLGMDYNVSSMILNFADGEKYKYIDIAIYDDDIPEGDEMFQLILANPSHGLELGTNTTAAITILANDDGHGILSFNNSEHFFLREPTAQYMTESVAVLYVFRDPPQGIFGTVTVQYLITGENYSDAYGDLNPVQGYIILEEGVRFKTLEITALLDEEPEMDEHFVVTLSNPTGGARLGTRLHTNITVLQNQAPQGLFSIFPTSNRTSVLTIEEGNLTVYLKVSRSNGLNMSVSVEWETMSGTALGIKGPYDVLSVLQNFQSDSASRWRFFSYADTTFAILLRSLPVNQAISTIYEWRGIFIPIQDFTIEQPTSCMSFAANGSQFVIITGGDQSSNNIVYTFTLQQGLSQTQTLTVPETSNVEHFSSESQDYLIITSHTDSPESSQIFVLKNCIFIPHQKLPISGISGLTVFTRGEIAYMAVSFKSSAENALVYTWAGNQFGNPQDIPIKGATQVESSISGADVYIMFSEVIYSSITIFLWESGRTFFRMFQSIPIGNGNMIHSFTPPSGLVHILHAGENISTLYSLNSEMNRFAPVLLASASKQLISTTVKSLNLTKTVIAQVGDFNSQIFELTSVSNQSDFIPSSGELKFEPGQSEGIFAVNILDDLIPEEDESFRIKLKNPKGGAEIGVNSFVSVTILTNDDAHGVIAFAQNSLVKQAEEMDQDNLISFSVERLQGTNGRVAVEWFANGSVTDISPASGVVTFSDGQALTTITVTVVADHIAELTETITVTLTKVITMNIPDPLRGAKLDPKRSKAVLIILPNDSPHGVIGWHANSLSVNVEEPEGNVTTITLQVVREQGFVGDIAIYVQSKANLSLPPSNQATENQDYSLNDKMIIIRENKTFAFVKINILPDNIPELHEGFLLNITAVQFVNFSASSGQPVIKRPGEEIAEIAIQENDEPRGVFQFNVTKDLNGAVVAYEVPSPQNMLRLPIVRQAGTFSSVTIYWEATAITASQEDFTPSSGNLTFSEGQALGIIEIAILDDTIIEYLEIFTVTLKHLTNRAKFGNETTVLVHIPPNDSPLGQFGFENKMVTVSEPQSMDDPSAMVTFTVVRSQGGHGAVKIIWILEEAAQYDITPLNGTLIFNESDSRKSFTLQAIQDGLLEGEERYTIQLVSADYSVISPVDGTATVVISGDVGASGIIGIAPSTHHILIGEPCRDYNGTAHISLVRGPGIFGEVTVYWNITPAHLGEFVELSGKVTMRDRQSAAVVVIQATNDDVPEQRSYYQFQLSKIDGGGIIDEYNRVANITMASSDLPYGRFEFSRMLVQISEEEQWANITIIRSGGKFGEIMLKYHTLSGLAASEMDFTSTSGNLMFAPNETIKPISIEIKNDDNPEGPEDFFLLITEVELRGRDYDYTIRENELQIDQPPVIGNNSMVRIVILQNDNAEGIIQFDAEFLAVEVEEDVGMLVIPVVRLHGAYGYVSADFVTFSISALPNSVDYNVPNTSVIFHHEQRRSFINISITDDEESELAEQFEIRLVGASGGAVLGNNIVCVITIAKSDSLSGVIRFLNYSQITLPNPNVSLALSLVLERTGGQLGDIQIFWNILGPNSKQILPVTNDDFSEPLNGTFYFNDGEDGLRTINLTILPHGEIEVQEKFIIFLSVVKGDSKVDPKAGNVTLTILQFGDPNGIIEFVAESRVPKNYTEPATSQGPLNITLGVKRVQGTLGNLTIYWQLSSDSDIKGDFAETTGWIVIPDKQNYAEIVLQLLPDDVPEIDEIYTVRLTYVDGGADLDKEKSFLRFTVLANDEPHGIFTVYPSSQTIIVNNDLSRYVQVNVTRLAGTFGNVTVEYQVILGSSEQENMTEKLTGNVLIRNGASYGISTVPISAQVLLLPGFNFTLELTNVILMGESTFGKPQILKEQKPASVSVPMEAANSKVGFESIVFHLTNSTSGRAHAVLSRDGVYGSVAVSWSAGYPLGLMPQNTRLGKITPHSGVVDFIHGEDIKIISLDLEADTSGPEAFAVRITNVSSSVPGGAFLRSGFTFAEFEPMGVFQFTSNSKYLVVHEEIQTISLQVQRLYGFQGDKIKLHFQTISGSAKALEDYVPIDSGELIFEKYQTSSNIEISIIDDNSNELDEFFLLNLTSVESVGIYQAKPQINIDSSLSTITILANDAIHGFVSIGPAIIYVEEDTNNSALNIVSIHIKRTHGSSGIVHATLSPFGGLNAVNGLDGLPFENMHKYSNLSWATESLDFEEQAMLITLKDGENETKVSFRILDDEEPEGMEIFYVFLKDPTGGVQIIEGKDESGYASFSTIIIRGNDMQNGILGFTMESLVGLWLDEDSPQRTAELTVSRQANRAFEDVKIFWRATFNKTSVELYRDGVNLVNELQAVSGYTICTAGQTECIISVEVKPDKVPEIETYFFVELYDVSAGASLNSSTRFAKILILESDAPHGLLFFAVGSRVVVAHKTNTLISLQISKESSSSQPITVGYITKELKKAEVIGHTTISPAIAGQDFVSSEGTLTFESGQRTVLLDISLTPERGSLNPFPKRLQVLLVDPSGGAKIDVMYGIANITIFSDLASQSTWGLIDQLYQPFDESILNRVLQTLNNKAGAEISEEQLGAIVNIMEKITHDSEDQVLADQSRILFYDVLCSLVSPERLDTRGYSPLIDVAEKYAFSLLTGVKCGSPGEKGKTIFDTCPYISISAYHWYPQQINGHRFDGNSGDSIQVPEGLVTLSPSNAPNEEGCKSIQFTEYSSQQWFLTDGAERALNNKILSVSLKDHIPYPLTGNDEVIYRIHAAGSRIVPRMSLCLLWNQASERWLANGQFCKIVFDTSDYVECACSHMSSYAVFAHTDSLSYYNEAFFCAGFICISGFTLAILLQLFCSRSSVFAAKLLTHMMFACLGTQISFLACAYISRELSDDSCSALASVTHYFYLSQFIWMLIQAVNFWYVLVMNDEHTERRHLIFIVLGWGLPAVVVILHLIVLKSIYHKSMADIYGLVYGDMCFIPNVYTALFTVALVPLVCLVVVFVVFIHAYQVTQQWKAYDDVFRGRPNATEIPLILYLFALISITCLWGWSAHGYIGHLWMLVLFIVFNSLQFFFLLGPYVFVVYFILHNQLCCPVKASYSIEMDGQRSPGSAFFTPSSGMPPAGAEINKSTQNLISAMEEISADWDRPGSQRIKQGPQNGAFTTPGGYSNGSLVADEELQEFDDLIFVLKAGSGLNISDTESCHGSQDGSPMPNSQIVELRRIPIADTHL